MVFQLYTTGTPWSHPRPNPLPVPPTLSTRKWRGSPRHGPESRQTCGRGNRGVSRPVLSRHSNPGFPSSTQHLQTPHLYPTVPTPPSRDYGWNTDTVPLGPKQPGLPDRPLGPGGPEGPGGPYPDGPWGHSWGNEEDDTKRVSGERVGPVPYLPPFYSETGSLGPTSSPTPIF